MTNAPRFIHLRTHSEYSLLEGAMRLKKLPDLVRGADMPAIALTDTNNMFAALGVFSGHGRARAFSRSLGVRWMCNTSRPAPVNAHAPLRLWCCWRSPRRAMKT